MRLAIEIMAIWIALSIAAVPLWAYALRHRRQADADFHRWVAAHPGTSIAQMPTDLLFRYSFD